MVARKDVHSYVYCVLLASYTAIASNVATDDNNITF